MKLQVPPHVFTDVLSCLKIHGTWKIVQKVMILNT
ncbi:nuclear transport factor 2 family protein [Mesorhizobium japonicum]